MKTRFQVQSLEYVALGEVVHIPLDGDGYVLGDIGSYVVSLKGATVIGKGTRNGYRRFFLGWTEHDEDLPRDAVAFVQDHMSSIATNLQFVPDIVRFKQYMQLGSSNRVIRLPETQRASSVKLPPSGDALVCMGCKEPVLQASPNMADGSFKCYSCRTNPYR